jgi:hypothetical protein
VRGRGFVVDHLAFDSSQDAPCLMQLFFRAKRASLSTVF